jgi:hypothetical protein
LTRDVSKPFPFLLLLSKLGAVLFSEMFKINKFSMKCFA